MPCSFSEIRPRKAKYAFKSVLQERTLVCDAELITRIKSNYRRDLDWAMELSVTGPRATVTIYTEIEAVAEAIRNMIRDIDYLEII